MTLDVLMISKNNAYYFQNLFMLVLDKLERFGVNFYIYENNSTDKTGYLLRKLSQQHSNLTVWNESSKVYLNRYVNICQARNRLLDLYQEELKNKKKEGTEWILLLDTNILFHPELISEMLALPYKYPSGNMFCPFTRYYNERHQTSQYYYDLLALNYGDYFKQPGSDKLEFTHLFPDNPEVGEIQTGFGGLCLIKSDILLNLRWKMLRPQQVKNATISKFILCEHWLWCENIRKTGKIYMYNTQKCIWFMDSVLEDLNQNKKFCQYLVIEKYLVI